MRVDRSWQREPRDSKREQAAPSFSNNKQHNNDMNMTIGKREAAVRTVNPDGLTIRVVKIGGIDYAPVSELAQAFRVSRETIVEWVVLFQQSHEVKVFRAGERSLRINVADFYTALRDVFCVSNRIAKGV